MHTDIIFSESKGKEVELILKDSKLFNKQTVGFDDCESIQFIYSDLYQALSCPDEYPAFIQVHSEWPIQNVPLHWHTGPELIYSRNQEMTIMVDMEKNYVRPGECILISSGAIHSIEPKLMKKDQDVMSIVFDGVLIEKMYKNLRNTKICMYQATVSDLDRYQLVEYCEKIRKLLDEEPLDLFALNELLYKILGLIFRKFVSKQHSENTKSVIRHQKMSRILKYVEEHYREELTVQAVASQFGYSREYFSRLFKRYSNVCFKQYINEYRLMKASTELYTTDKRVADIAFENGFSDEKGFYTSFKKKYGMTPLEFRRKKYQKISD